MSWVRDGHMEEPLKASDPVLEERLGRAYAEEITTIGGGSLLSPRYLAACLWCGSLIARGEKFCSLSCKAQRIQFLRDVKQGKAISSSEIVQRFLSLFRMR